MTLRRDPYAPRFEIRINDGNYFPESIKRLIRSVSYDDDDDKFDMITIEMDMMETTPNGSIISLIDSKIFSPGNLIELEMGYGNKIQSIGAGYIVKAKPSFSASGPTFRIEAYDAMYKLSQKKNKLGRNFPRSPDKTTIETLVSESGMDLVTSLTVKDSIVNRFQPAGMSDYKFIKNIANVLGLDFFVRYDPSIKRFTAYLQQPTDKGNQIYTFKYFEKGANETAESSLLSFDPEMSVVDQATNFEIVAWDNKTKSKITNAIKRENDDADEVIPSSKTSTIRSSSFKDARDVTFKAFGQVNTVIPNKPFKTENEAKIYIEQWLKKRMDHFIIGTANVVGLEVLQTRQKHIFQGIGNIYSGKYYITRVNHSMGRDKPYQCQLDVRKVVDTVEPSSLKSVGDDINTLVQQELQNLIETVL